MTTIRILALPALLAAAPVAAQFPTTPPAPAPVKPAEFPPFQERTLPNGLRMIVVERHTQPVVSLSMSFPAGNRYEPVGHQGLADLFATVLTKGAGNRDADQISSTIEGVGGSIAAGAGLDFLTVRTDVLTPDAGLAFSLLADVVQRPTFPEKEIELARTQMLSGLQLELSQPSSIASRTFARELYGKHPYALRPTPATVKAITRGDLVAFQKLRLRPGGALLVVAGDLTANDAVRLATQHFGSWTGTVPASAVMATPPVRTKTEIVLVHRPGSVQSNIVMGNTTFTPTDPRYFATTVASRVLGGGSSGRLFTILREQKSWTYGAYSGLTRYRDVGNFQATAEVRTEVTDSALAEMITQVRRMGREPVPAVELSAAKDAMVGRFPLTIQTANQVADAVATAKLLGLPANYLQTYRPKLAAVTAPEVMAASTANIRADRALIVVVGDATKIYDKLAKIAPVRVITPDGTPVPASELKGPVAGAALPVDLSLIVPGTDSFSIMVQGNTFGYQVNETAKTPTGFVIRERSSIGPVGQQSTEVTFTSKLAPVTVKQIGKIQGQDTKIDVTYGGGRVKGTAATPAPGGPKTITYDTTVVAGAIDDNMLTTIIPALPWKDGAKFSANVFQSGRGTAEVLTLTAAGHESVTVPAGTFDAMRIDVSGSQQPVSFMITTAAPHKILKIMPVGAPIEIVRVK